MSQGVTGRARQKGRVMRFIRKAMIGLAALAALPLAAQGPVPAPAAKTTEATVPTAKTQAAPAPLDTKDLEAWMDGYLPYALERGRLPGARAEDRRVGKEWVITCSIRWAPDN